MPVNFPIGLGFAEAGIFPPPCRTCQLPVRLDTRRHSCLLPEIGSGLLQGEEWSLDMSETRTCRVEETALVLEPIALRTITIARMMLYRRGESGIENGTGIGTRTGTGTGTETETETGSGTGTGTQIEVAIEVGKGAKNGTRLVIRTTIMSLAVCATGIEIENEIENEIQIEGAFGIRSGNHCTDTSDFDVTWAVCSVMIHFEAIEALLPTRWEQEGGGSSQRRKLKVRLYGCQTWNRVETDAPMILTACAVRLTSENR